MLKCDDVNTVQIKIGTKLHIEVLAHAQNKHLLKIMQADPYNVTSFQVLWLIVPESMLFKFNRLRLRT